MGCGARATKRELLRVTAGSGVDGRPAVLPDPDGTAPGRGAHLHPTTACLDLAERRRAFPRALRVQGPLDLTPLQSEIERHGDTTDRTQPAQVQTDEEWSGSS